jgi:hypothetical protein
MTAISTLSLNIFERPSVIKAACWVSHPLSSLTPTTRQFFLLALSTFGVQTDRNPLVWNFEGSSLFKTYQLERTLSVSANWNLLLALLTSPGAD